MTARHRLPVIDELGSWATKASAPELEAMRQRLGLPPGLKREECREWELPCQLYGCKWNLDGALMQNRRQPGLFGESTEWVPAGAREASQLERRHHVQPDGSVVEPCALKIIEAGESSVDEIAAHLGISKMQAHEDLNTAELKVRFLASQNIELVELLRDECGDGFEEFSYDELRQKLAELKSKSSDDDDENLFSPRGVDAELERIAADVEPY